MATSQKSYNYKGQTFDSEQAMVMYLLDDYRCVEGFAAQYLSAWKAISTEACVTGGLRTVCGREQLHADLLEARLRELGGTPQCEVPEERLAEIPGSAALVAKRMGGGRLIAFMDNPNFRAFWYGTNRLFLNAVFFGKTF